MAERDYEVIRQAWAAASRGDISAQLPYLDPDVEIIPFGPSMEGNVRDGKIVRWQTYTDRAEALGALGLKG